MVLGISSMFIFPGSVIEENVVERLQWRKGGRRERGTSLCVSLFYSLIFLILLPDLFWDRIAEAYSKISYFRNRNLYSWTITRMVSFGFSSSFVTFYLNSFLHWKYINSRIGEQIFISGTTEAFQCLSESLGLPHRPKLSEINSLGGQGTTTPAIYFVIIKLYIFLRCRVLGALA